MARSGWKDEVEVEDEFTCPGVLQATLLKLKPTVEQMFSVTLRISEEKDEQIWLHLAGRKREAEAAKLFVIGVVNQEAQQEVQYPAVLHCVFCGVEGFFTKSLIRVTSAHILVGSLGCLLISGLSEPVVKAYSLIIDLMERHKNSQSQHSEATAQSMQTCRDFKSLIEKLKGSHTLDLLVLPALVKEVLLDLVRQSGLKPDSWNNVTSPAGGRAEMKLLEGMDKLEIGGSIGERTFKKPETAVANGTPKDFPTLDPPPDFIPDIKEQGSSNKGETEVPLRPTFQEKKHQSWSKGPSAERKEVGEGNLVSSGSKQDNEHLVKFFTTMGFSEQVVFRVLAHTGPREPSELLDLIQQEQDKAQVVKGAMKEDFMLDLLKKSAASCGYTEDKVDEICSNFPELSHSELIQELQRNTNRESEAKEQKIKDQAKQMTDPQRRAGMERPGNDRVPGGTSNRSQEGGQVDLGEEWKFQEVLMQPSLLNRSHFRIAVPPTVCGPPRPRYSSSPLPNIADPQFQLPEPSISRTQQKPPPNTPGAVITGQQRFLEGLTMPFKLQLNDEHGDPGLRQIIIDGSNVAMTHGLGVFFSCRGIALAVQYFWSRGHRKITTLVPQWRKRKDPKIKEPHFMMQLQELGLLSFTPSRIVQGQRINSYDDRYATLGEAYIRPLMLQLANKTDGVIVTNDNLRDLVDESVEWKEIIKSRLLQYVFAGDLFMVPDDPLGRNGPHIDKFLRTKGRPIQGSHSFAGVTSTPAPPFPSQPRAQTDVLQSCEGAPGVLRRTHDSGRSRTAEETQRIKEDLRQIFPGQDDVITKTLQHHLSLTDINQLSYFILEQIEGQE